ncbi:hypothetical protein AAIL08_001043 [Campylobacter upsaliensis]|uniref:Small hydrophobic protein n=2 Tax=Campylobacter TaxID=194 RepID=A0A3X8R4K1_CAMUP|nr:hypothetical protein [Campylobacter upsaliensis]EAH5217403.1 hypothetical protein [Campylobacter upsaliensis]EAH5546280.1 hypothetical protein [Campylobacter upsaliensis]EAH5553123.1 hypothetical protein [Campylobacter upsaliensis]EAH5676443.1 hypothetical protein [Campylobacter upsaliensis]
MLEFLKFQRVKMAILEFILIFLFVLLMAFLIIGFNRQMLEKAKEREKRLEKYNKRRDFKEK